MMDDAELRRLAAAATPGPWEYREMVEPGSAGVTHPHGWVDAVIASGADEMRDAAYIAAANPATMLALLDRLEKAEKDAARVDCLEKHFATFASRPVQYKTFRDWIDHMQREEQLVADTAVRGLAEPPK